VRASVATANIPVLLTVGKLEPYPRPEEANRVRADGVIVKPFEASDLLAIVKKFEERISLAAVPKKQPELVERFTGNDADESSGNPENILTTSQPTVEVPDHMATTSAFSDLLGTDTSNSSDPFKASAPPAARDTAPQAAVVPDYTDVPFSWRDAADSEAYASTAASLPTPAIEIGVAKPSPATQPARLLQIPVYREPELETEEPVKSPEIVPTAVPATEEIEIFREPALQETAEEATRNTVADSTEPGLVPTMQEEAAPAPVEEAAVPEAEAVVPEPEHVPELEPAPMESQDGSAYPQDIPASIASEPPVEMPAPAPRVEESMDRLGKLATISDTDFEARVAAAIAAYSHADASSQQSEAPAAESSADALEHAPAITASDMNGQPAAAEAAPAEAFDTSAAQSPAEPEPAAPAFEYYPPIGAPHTTQASKVETTVVEPVVPEPVVESAPFAYVPATYVPAATEPTPPEVAAKDAVASTDQDHVSASVEAALPTADEIAAAAAAQTEADHHTITQAVHRVMERLKSELVEEIMRELKSKK
jgi:hypothetical protein